MTRPVVQCARSDECPNPATRVWTSETFGKFTVCGRCGAELDTITETVGDETEGEPA